MRRDKLTRIVAFRVSSIDLRLLQLSAKRAGLEVPVFLRRLMREKITSALKGAKHNP